MIDPRLILMANAAVLPLLVVPAIAVVVIIVPA